MTRVNSLGPSAAALILMAAQSISAQSKPAIAMASSYIDAHITPEAQVGGSFVRYLSSGFLSPLGCTGTIYVGKLNTPILFEIELDLEHTTVLVSREGELYLNPTWGHTFSANVDDANSPPTRPTTIFAHQVSISFRDPLVGARIGKAMKGLIGACQSGKDPRLVRLLDGP